MATSFQSQLGSIGASSPDRMGSIKSIVSIPAWFDWRGNGAGAYQLRQRSFNPSLVRLAPEVDERGHGERCPFQSQLGSIGAPLLQRCQRRQCQFQSQLGSIGAVNGQCKCLPKARFQSQLGSIGAERGSVEASAPRGFQSQLGSIGAAPPSTCRACPSAFQSQLGSIGARRLGAILHMVQIRLGTFPPAARGYVTVDPR